jgi:hypothetical protein
VSETHSCACCMTRRQCLQYLSAATIAAGIGVPEKSAAVAQSDVIDVSTLRPKPRVSVAATLLRLPRPYWLGWPGTTFDIDRHSRECAANLAASAKALGIETALPSAAIENEAGLNALIGRVKNEPPDALLVILQHMACWAWVERLTQEIGVPLLVMSPIGTSFTGHVAGISRRPGVYVISSLEWSAVEAGLRMVRAKRMFEESRILWIQGDSRNETVLDRLGTKVRAIPRKTFNERFDRVPLTEEVRAIANDVRRRAKKVVEPTLQDSYNSARALVAAKQLITEQSANALSMDCLGMVGSRLVPTPPCGAWTYLQDHGITAGCEADLFGATSLMLTSYLLDRPGYMNDPVAETAKNLLITSHCTCGTRLNGFDKPPVPYILRNHSESALGVSVQVLWPVGQPVTLVRFTQPGEMIVDTGTVVSNVDTPPAGGCRTSLELKMDDIEDARDVLGFHQVVTLGNHKRTVRQFCQLYGIKPIHSPQRSLSGEGAA